LHPDQRALPIAELSDLTVYAYSFILTNLDVSTPALAAEVEHWYRHRTQIENRNILCGSALWRWLDLRVWAAQRLTG